MVDPDSGRIPRVPPYSGTAPSRGTCVSRTGLSPSLAARPSAFRYAYANSRSPRRRPTTPQPSPAVVWAPPRSLAATGGISVDFLSCWYLDGSLPSVFLRRAIYSRAGAGHSLPAGYPIREPRDRRMLAPTPGLSRLAAPFFASQLPGIHSWTLVSLDHIVISVPSL